MSLDTLFVHTVTTYRMQAVAGIRSGLVQKYVLKCMIQPISNPDQLIEGMVWGNTFKGYFHDYADVRVGDRLLDQSGQAYSVTGTNLVNYGSGPHIECMLTVDNSTKADVV